MDLLKESTTSFVNIWFWACSKSHLLATATFDVKALQGPPPYEQKRNSLAQNKSQDDTAHL